MIATGKHFPGRGHSEVDAHFQVPVIDVELQTLRERELLPYKKLIAENLLPSVMIAHSIFPAIDPDNIATVSRKVITGLLREELGFQGVIATDSMTMGAIATRYGVANACALSLEAGADLVLMKAENHLVEEVIEAIRSFVLEGRIPEEQLDDKVYRILSLKYEYGLFEPEEDRENPEDVLADQGIRQLARQAARRSILTEHNQDRAIPVRGRSHRRCRMSPDTRRPPGSSGRPHRGCRNATGCRCTPSPSALSPQAALPLCSRTCAAARQQGFQSGKRKSGGA